MTEEITMQVENMVIKAQQLGFNIAINQIVKIIGEEAENAIQSADIRSLTLLQQILQKIAEVAGPVDA
jgi:hypothetical protein